MIGKVKLTPKNYQFVVVIASLSRGKTYNSQSPRTARKAARMG
jgi:hypothetical protein